MWNIFLKFTPLVREKTKLWVLPKYGSFLEAVKNYQNKMLFLKKNNTSNSSFMRNIVKLDIWPTPNS